MQTQKIYDVRELGAAGDGNADDTTAIQSAIDLCCSEGGGKVLLPRGTYPIKPLVLRSGVNLHLEEGALLLGSADPADYPEWKSKNINTEHGNPLVYNARYLIVADDAHDISITGKGTINGQGPAHYDTKNTKGLFWPIRDRATRPGRMIWFIHCTNVLVEDAIFLDSPAWTFWVLGCENVTFRKITIRTPFEEMNADGIDIDCSRNVHISHCDIKTGDDCIVLRGINRALHGTHPCEQVTVEHCRLQSNCNAIRIGYVRDGTIRNATFNNISITNSRRGIICQIPAPKVLLDHPEPHYWDDRSQNGISVPVIENIQFSNISIQAAQPLWFYLDDEAIASRLANIRFENLTLVGSTASVFKGNSKTWLENISLHNICVTIRNEKTFWSSSNDLPEKALGLEISYCRNLQVSNLIIDGSNETKEDESPVINVQRSIEIYISQLINNTPYPDTN